MFTKHILEAEIQELQRLFFQRFHQKIAENSKPNFPHFTGYFSHR